MGFYNDMNTTATELVTAYGEAITIQSPDPTFDADAGTSSGTPATATGYGTFRTLRTDLENNIEAGDMLLTSTVAIDTDDIVIRADSTQYQVVEVGEINPAGVVVVYTARVRQ